ILMTSFAFGLGVVPLVLATGAGAVSRISLGLSVLSGIIASTCLAVLFVPSFFAVLQKLDERRVARKRRLSAGPAADAAEGTEVAPFGAALSGSESGKLWDGCPRYPVKVIRDRSDRIGRGGK